MCLLLAKLRKRSMSSVNINASAPHEDMVETVSSRKNQTKYSNNCV